jgi:hypothetical protein
MTIECGKYHIDVEEDLLPSPETKSRLRDVYEKDEKLLLSIGVLFLLMIMPFGRYLLYPFTLLSTWVHEMCHGIAAVFCGGSINNIYIYDDGSGLANTSIQTPFFDFKRVFVASAGYVGTAIVGGVLLLFRRTRRGPRRVLFGTAVLIAFTCLLWVRNTFGVVSMILIAAGLGLAGWFLPAEPCAYVYAFVAAAICLNTVDSITDIWNDRQCTSGERRSNDAVTVAEVWGLPYWFWALLWLVFALGMLFIGMVFVINPSDGAPSAPYAERKTEKNSSSQMY